MNLLTEAWMPVRTRAGSRRWISPDRLADADLVAFDADRPDFNGALVQFAIGLLQTTTPVDNAIQWRRLFDDPPDLSTLADWFRPARSAFQLDGDGPRFMQESTLPARPHKVKPISLMFIDSPAENTLDENRDHFVKRGRIQGVCRGCAACALIALQLNAPSGGPGYYTSLRGGGPLTTIVLAEPGQSLWHDLWLNVLERAVFLSESGSQLLAELRFSFPWMAKEFDALGTAGVIAPLQVHPSHVYWAIPRRICFDFKEPARGNCDVCGRACDELVTKYATMTKGFNYKGPWLHPLAPYYDDEGEWRPVHPQPGGIGYRHWLALVQNGVLSDHHYRSARNVVNLLQRRHRAIGGLRLWAFGYDVYNSMKIRAWQDTTMPIYSFAECDTSTQRRVEAEVTTWIAAAELAASYLYVAVKEAWFSGTARGDFSAIDASFWSRTEAPFYAQLQGLIDAARANVERDEQPVLERWLATLANAARYLFDEVFVGCGAVERGHPKRVAQAWQQLQRNLAGPKLRAAVGLPDLSPSKPRSAKAAKPAKPKTPA